MLSIKLQVMPHFVGLPLPAYQSDQAAGLDLPAAVDAPLLLPAGQRAAVPTGLIVELPPGYEAQIRPRSGLALKYGITVLNAPGTVDADYRGEVKVILVNLSQEDFTVERGMRVAQMVIAPVTRAAVQTAAALNDSPRGDGGFGSTGL